MKKVIRLTESDLVNLIERVLQEQSQTESPECQKVKKRINSYKLKGERIIRFAPQKTRAILSSLFQKGIEEGPEAFKKGIPQQMKQDFEKRIKNLRKPKSDSELDLMISDAENEINQIQEASSLPMWLQYTILISSWLFILLVFIWAARNNFNQDIGGVCF